MLIQGKVSLPTSSYNSVANTKSCFVHSKNVSDFLLFITRQSTTTPNEVPYARLLDSPSRASKGKEQIDSKISPTPSMKHESGTYTPKALRIPAPKTSSSDSKLTVDYFQGSEHSVHHLSNLFTFDIQFNEISVSATIAWRNVSFRTSTSSIRIWFRVIIKSKNYVRGRNNSRGWRDLDHSNVCVFKCRFDFRCREQYHWHRKIRQKHFSQPMKIFIHLEVLVYVLPPIEYLPYRRNDLLLIWGMLQPFDFCL